MVKISGPNGQINFLGGNKFLLKGENVTKDFDEVSMICGGSGITPMYQIIQHVLADEKSSLKLHLMFFNVTKEDILLKKELAELNGQKRISIKYSLDKPDEDWDGYVGFFRQEMAEESLPQASARHLAMLCGPPRMVVDSERTLLKMGFAEENVHTF